MVESHQNPKKNTEAMLNQPSNHGNSARKKNEVTLFVDGVSSLFLSLKICRASLALRKLWQELNHALRPPRDLTQKARENMGKGCGAP